MPAAALPPPPPPPARFDFELVTTERSWEFGCGDAFAAAQWLMYLHAARPAHVEGVRRAADAAAARVAGSVAHPDVRTLPDDGGSCETHGVPALALELACARGSGIADCLSVGVGLGGGGGSGGGGAAAAPGSGGVAASGPA